MYEQIIWTAYASPFPDTLPPYPQHEGRRGPCEAHPKKVCRCRGRDAPANLNFSAS